MEQNQNSENSQIQLRKPDSFYNFITTQDEADIVESIEKGIVLQKNNETILQIVSTWRAMVGIPKQDVSEELILAAQYISKEYGFLTEQELYLAITLSIKRVLKDCEFKGYFSPYYIASVLESYLHYRKLKMADAIRRREKYIREQQEINNKPTPKQQAENMKEIIKGLYDEWQQHGYIKDSFNLAYNFLRRVKWLNPSKEQIEEALVYGKKMTSLARSKDFKRVGESPEIIKIEEDRYSRNYCVQKYFETVSIDVLLNNIKEEFFLS